MKTIQNIIDHTLKGPNGKWSRKSLQMFTSFSVAIIIGLYIVVSHHFTEREVSMYAIQVFFGLLAVSFGTGVLTVWDKIKGKEIDNERSINNYDPDELT